MSKASLILNFGERDTHDGYSECLDCGSRTMLVSAMSHWTIDDEPFKAGENFDVGMDMVEVSAEITGHWCNSCEKLTTLCVHQD